MVHAWDRPTYSEHSMKKILALVLVSSFATMAFAADEKKVDVKKPACGMACCEKNKVASCKDCPDCGKKKDAPKKEAPKSEAPAK
jgi:hypothetical protein